MRALVVIGANYGDEGKGRLVDWLVARHGTDSVVVRSTGGAQAGHTVALADGQPRHVVHHLGSGTLRGAATHMSRFIALLEEMDEADRERLVCALDELRFAFCRFRQHGSTRATFISRLTVSQRRSLFRHAGLTDQEFSMPHWRLNEDDCYWRDKLFRALRELFSLFGYAPTILTSVKPEQYLH